MYGLYTVYFPYNSLQQTTATWINHFASCGTIAYFSGLVS